MSVLHSILLPFMVLVILVSQVFGVGKGRTLDACSTNSDCASYLRCFVNMNGIIRRCPSLESRTKCQCLPRLKKPIYCGQKPYPLCPSGEGCGRSTVTNNEICVSCNHMQQNPNWNVLDPRQCKGRLTPAPSPSTSPAPAQKYGSFEMCSAGSQCLNGTKCKISQRLQCIFSDPLCKCLPNSNSFCRKNRDCGSGEVCARNSQTGKRSCVACSVAQNDIFFIAQNAPKCQNLPNPTPNFPPAPNGLFGDVCFSDRDCHGEYKCTGNASGRPCKLLSDIFCFCRCSEASRNSMTCRRSNACPIGESCAFIDLWGVKRCVSDTFIKQLNPTNVDVKGINSRTPKGSNAVGDTCKFNYDCRDELACTHREGTYGGCIGRDGCTCIPRAFQKCANDRMCPAGEKCMNYPGAKNEPFCYSGRAVRGTFLESLLKPAGNINGLSGWDDTQIGSGSWQPCRSNSDCNSRTCVHYAENIPLNCNGRPTCFCRHRNPTPCKFNCPQGETCVKLIGSFNQKGECMANSTLKGLGFDEIYERL